MLREARGARLSRDAPSARDGQTDRTHVALSASGFSGAALFGALHVLAPLLEDVRHYAGSSGGALAAFVHCAGLDPREAAELCARGVERDAHVLGALRASTIVEAWHGLGLARPDAIERTLRDVLAARIGRRRASLRDFAQATGRVLAVWTTNLSTGRGQALTLDSHPELDVVTAVLASMAVPLLYRPVEIEGDLHTDGAVTEFLPDAAFPGVPRGRVLRVALSVPAPSGPPVGLLGLAAAALTAAVRHRSIPEDPVDGLVLDVEPAWPVVGDDLVVRFDIDPAKVWRQFHAAADQTEAWLLLPKKEPSQEF